MVDQLWTPSQLKGNRAKLRAARKVAKGAREPRDRGVNRVSQQKEGDQNCGFRRLLKGEEERGRVWSILARGVLRQRQSDYKIIYCPDRPNQQGREGTARARRAREGGQSNFSSKSPKFSHDSFPRQPLSVCRSRSAVSFLEDDDDDGDPNLILLRSSRALPA